MADSAGTSDSAASSGARPSPPDSSGDNGPAPATPSAVALRVDFYVLHEASAPARLKLACKLAEKAYLSGQSALVWHTDADELRAFDEMLWTFMDGSFVPHDVVGPGATAAIAPVMLSVRLAPPERFDIIINLAPDVPSCLSQTGRVAELIDGEDSRRRAGRARFKAYRDLGVQPATHNIRAE
jgi:DNA polymerase-3 subunit chi